MDLLSLLILIVIAGICGAIAEFIVGFTPGDLLRTIVIGVVGAYIGNLLGLALARGTGEVIYNMVLIKVGTIVFSLIWAIVGSALLLLVLSLLRGGRRRRILSRGNTAT